MEVDLHVPRFDWAGGPETIGQRVADLARRAEALDIRAMSFMDHYFQMDDMAPVDDPMLEGYTTLGFIAALTSRLRLRLLVTGITYRYPGALAKIVTTLDVLSGGRGELGIGAAWYEREHKGLGIPFPPVATRFEQLEETLQICLQMWSDNDGPFNGEHFQLAETLCYPRPVSQPRPRIMIGGVGERKTLRLVAQYADACNLFGTPAEVAHKIGVLRRHCDGLGRDIASIDITTLVKADEDWTTTDLVRAAEDYGAVGVNTITVMPLSADPAGKLEAMFGPVMQTIRSVEPALV